MKPPIVSDLLESKAFNGFLNNHLDAADILSDVRAETSNGVSFEVALRRQQDSSNEHIGSKMRFVPIALEQFFYRVSEDYTNQPENYSALVGRTVGRGITTAFVTVNYDTILDQVLCRYRPGPRDNRLRTVGSYVASPDWLLVKLHGSVDWGYRYGTPTEGIADTLLTQGLRTFDRAEIEVADDPYGLRIGPAELYPALALPVTGKPGFVCHPSHEAALVELLQDCSNFLFIGFSAKDSDLLDFLTEHVRTVQRLRIVTAPDDMEGVQKRLHAVAPFRRSLAAILPQHTYTSFTEFVRLGLGDLANSILGDSD